MRREIALVQKPVVKYAREVWGLIVTKGFGFNGMQDMVFWIPGGQPLLMEFKDPNGQVSTIQHYWVNYFRGIGYNVKVCSNAKDGKGIISREMGARSLPSKSD